MNIRSIIGFGHQRSTCHLPLAFVVGTKPFIKPFISYDISQFIFITNWVSEILREERSVVYRSRKQKTLSVNATSRHIKTIASSHRRNIPNNKRERLHSAVTITAAQTNMNKYIDIGANLLDGMYQGDYHGKNYHEPDLDDVLERSWDAGVEKIMVTAGNLDEARRAVTLCRQHQGVCACILWIV